MISSIRIPTFLPTPNGSLSTSLSKQSNAAPCVVTLTTATRSDDLFKTISSPKISNDILSELCNFEDDERAFLESPIVPIFSPPARYGALSPILEQYEGELTYDDGEDNDSLSVYSTYSEAADFEYMLRDAMGTMAQEYRDGRPSDFNFTPGPGGVIIHARADLNVPALVLVSPPEGDVDMLSRPYCDVDTDWTLTLPEPSLLAAPAMTVSGKVLQEYQYDVVQSSVCAGPAAWDFLRASTGDADEEFDEERGVTAQYADPSPLVETCPDVWDEDYELEEYDGQPGGAVTWSWVEEMDLGPEWERPAPGGDWENASFVEDADADGADEDEGFEVVGDEDFESLLDDVKTMERAPLLGYMPPSKKRGLRRWLKL